MSRFYIFFLITFIISLSQQEEALKTIPDLSVIFGGSTTTISSAKYLVSLRLRGGQMFCAGSLITYRYVVTAARCLQGLTSNQIIVHGGVTYLNEIGVRRTVMRIFRPNSFNANTIANGVAVVQLSRPMTGSNIATIPLCTTDIPPMSWVQVYGWGTISKKNFKTLGASNQLSVTALLMIDQQKCIQSYNSVLSITNTMMCAYTPSDFDSCQGDLGGPLEYHGQLCGINSYGTGCTPTGYPRIYTSISAYKQFIIKAINS